MPKFHSCFQWRNRCFTPALVTSTSRCLELFCFESEFGNKMQSFIFELGLQFFSLSLSWRSGFFGTSSVCVCLCTLSIGLTPSLDCHMKTEIAVAFLKYLISCKFGEIVI